MRKILPAATAFTLAAGAPVLAALMVTCMTTAPSYAQQPADSRSPTASVPEGPRPLTEGGLRNLVAFTRLLGYVRHFHPSDQAAAADWDRLAVQGMRRVENCESPERLAAELEALFRSVAPTVQVFSSGAQRSTPRELAPPGIADLKVVYWRHRGAGQVALKLGDFPSIYTSERVYAAASSDSVSGDRVFSTDLGAGLAVRVPLKLYADAAGTLPRMAPPAPGEKLQLLANDRATRLAAVALAWNVFQHFYPYFDVVDTDWPLALRRALTAAATDADERAFVGTLRRLVAALHDGHGGVRPPTMTDRWWETWRSLPLAWALVEEKLVITHVLAEAAAVGLAPGDVVIEIDGQKTQDAISGARQLISSATPQWMRSRLAGHFGLGPADSAVRLRVRNRGGAEREVELRRTAKSEAGREPRPAIVSELEPGIVYFDIDRATDADWSAALPNLAQAKAVIFDLRGYPAMHTYLSHLSTEPLQSAIWQVPVVTRPDRLGPPEYDLGGRWQLPPQSPRLKGRIIFLTDGSAISYAESVMGIVEAYKLADIVGEPTAGTNGNVNAFTVPGGFRLSWTGMRVLKHDGSRHHGVGIRPTHPVVRTIKAVAEGRDEILERGLELARQSR
jgi:C-terminal processing protease CtpA/Prc